jgi:hypothetical protein
MKQTKIIFSGIAVGIAVFVAIILLGAFLLWFIDYGENLDNACYGKQWERVGKYWDEEIPIPEVYREMARYYGIKSGKAQRKLIEAWDCIREQKIFYFF